MTKHVRNNCVKSKKFRQYKGAWFRAYSADIDNYRLQTLPVAVRWFWFELHCLASTTGGILPDHEQIAFRLREPEHHVVAAIDVLISAKLLVMDCAPGEEPRLRLEGWADRQFVADNSTERVRRFRRKSDDETFHETQNETMKRISSISSTSLEDREVSIQEGKKTGSSKNSVGLGGAA
jgi:hypothetical protein